MGDTTNCVSCQASVVTAAATMTVDGLKCSSCVTAGQPPNIEIFGPAGPMPTKLIVLVALMGLGLVLNLLTMQIFGLVIGAALLAGVLVGNDGVRRFLKALAWVQLMFHLVVMLAALSWGDSTVLLFGFFGIAHSIFVIWTLGQEDVRTWMFRTAFKGGL